ncbi:MAG: MFS transporter [Chloroflexi bacterium]|nr:MFS transporter [Chloroflexota bacterium]
MPRTLERGPAIEAQSRGRVRTFRSLEDRNFRWFLTSIFSGFTSNDMQQFLRGWLVFELTGSFAALGLMSLINGLTGLLLALVGGVVADLVKQRKHVVQIGQGLSGINALVLALLVFADLLRVEHVLIAAALHGGSNNLTMPSRQALTPDVVGPERLMNAMGLYSTSQNAAKLLMPGLAGGMVGFLSDPGTIGGAAYVYVLIFSIYAVSVATMFPVRVPDRTPGARSFASLRGDLADGFRFVAGHRPLAVLLACNPLFALLGLGHFVMLPGFAKEVLDAGPGQLGLLTSVSGVGAVIGSLVVASLPGRRRGVLMLGSSVLLGVALVAFAASTSFWLSLAIILVVGLGQAGYLGLMNVLVQVLAGNTYRGRVMSIYMMEFNITQLLLFGMGILASIYGPRATFAAAGIALVLLALALLARSPTLRRIE